MYREQLMDCIEILKNKFWIIILTTVLLLIVAGIFSFYIIKPEYQTFSTLMIGKSQNYYEGIEYNDILLSQKLVSTYGEIAKSRTVSNEVIKNLGLDFTYEDIRKKVNIAQVGDTGIIRIESRDEKPEIAVKLADEIAKVFIKYVVRIMNIENVQIIDRAEIPTKPIKPVPIVYMTASGILGIIIGVFIVFLIEFLDNRIKTSDDIIKYLELPIIGIIP
jgi:capsular polysaccharide biosynthesis protein